MLLSPKRHRPLLLESDHPGRFLSIQEVEGLLVVEATVADMEQISSDVFCVDALALVFPAVVLRGEVLRVSHSIDRSAAHTLTVTVTDSYFNQMTATASFRFGENTGIPQVQITAPTKGSVLGKTGSGLTITADASDESGIKYVEFYLDDLLLARTPREPYTVTYPLDTVTPGAHRIRAVATDPSGKAGEDEEMITINL